MNSKQLANFQLAKNNNLFFPFFIIV